MLRAEPNNIQQRYILWAPRLVANIGSKFASGESQIEHLTADGGVVKLRSVKTANGELLSGVELECSRADYDAGQELFTAAGPGIIRLNNSKAAEPNEHTGGLNLRQPCYASVRDFATLKYSANENRIIADAKPGGTLQIIYIPVVKGKYGQQIEATAAHTEIDLVQAADGQTELSTLTASGGVTYIEGEDNELGSRKAGTQFFGNKLFYDHAKSIIKISGTESEPCFYNGVFADEIEYDLKTHKVKFHVVSPSTL